MVFVFMAGVTVAIAVVRLGMSTHFVYLEKHDHLFMLASGTKLKTNLLVYHCLSEFEAYLAVLVATFPAMRAFYRLKKTGSNDSPQKECDSDLGGKLQSPEQSSFE